MFYIGNDNVLQWKRYCFAMVTLLMFYNNDGNVYNGDVNVLQTSKAANDPLHDLGSRC